MAESIEKELSIMFASVCSSSSLYEKHGDKIAFDVINKCIAIMKDAVEKHHGRVVKTIGGNKVMAVFNTPLDATNSSVEMQKNVTEIDPSEVHGIVLAISIGFHHGNVLENPDDGDVFGDAVNVSARIAGESKAGRILTSGEAVARLPILKRHDTRFLEKLIVKGRQEPTEIYEFLWIDEECDATVAVTMIGGPTQIKRLVLELSYGGKAFNISETHPKITIGRATDSDLILNQALASRNHARVEYRGGSFYLIDKSTNGTSIIVGDKRVHIVAEEFVLDGEGQITAGKGDGSPDSMIAFRIYQK